DDGPKSHRTRSKKQNPSRQPAAKTKQPLSHPATNPQVLDKFVSKLSGSTEVISCADTKPLVWGNASGKGLESEAVKRSGFLLSSMSMKTSWANVVATGDRTLDSSLPEAHKEVGDLIKPNPGITRLNL
ncbi:hypothetical protein U1Q18_043590, partial [Sarracenia purpurea var. burkii]